MEEYINEIQLRVYSYIGNMKLKDLFDDSRVNLHFMPTRRSDKPVDDDLKLLEDIYTSLVKDSTKTLQNEDIIIEYFINNLAINTQYYYNNILSGFSIYDILLELSKQEFPKEYSILNEQMKLLSFLDIDLSYLLLANGLIQSIIIEDIHEFFMNGNLQATIWYSLILYQDDLKMFPTEANVAELGLTLTHEQLMIAHILMKLLNQDILTILQYFAHREAISNTELLHSLNDNILFRYSNHYIMWIVNKFTTPEGIHDIFRCLKQPYQHLQPGKVIDGNSIYLYMNLLINAFLDDVFNFDNQVYNEELVKIFQRFVKDVLKPVPLIPLERTDTLIRTDTRVGKDKRKFKHNDSTKRRKNNSKQNRDSRRKTQRELDLKKSRGIY